MPKFLDYDPDRDLYQYEDRTQGGNMQLHFRQDVEPVLDLARYERLNGLADKHGKQSKQDVYLYARIPPVVILKLKYEHGVDIFKRDDLKKAFEIINREYPHLKCTEKQHFLRN